MTADRPGVVALVPDLMDRSRISAAIPAVQFVTEVADLVAADKAAVLVLDLGRPEALEILPALAGRRVVGFASHVDRDVLEAAKRAGCDQVLPRSAFFTRLGELLA